MRSVATGPQTVAVVPVKTLRNAKQRLAAGVSAPDRERLAEAMFLDTVTKIRRSKLLDEVIVVTADPHVARTARWLGIDVLRQAEDGGHSESAAVGVKAALGRGADRVALLPADCPMFDHEEFDDHLGTIAKSALIVPDRHGAGTNALILSPPDAFAPAFGPGSCARHVSRARTAGVAFSIAEIESLALDLDTFEDLLALRDRLLLEPKRAPRTAEVIFEIESAAGEASAVV